MSWKKEAAIGGAVTIRTVKINPSPPCCNAMLLMPSVVAPVKLPTQKAAATASTIFNAMATITLNSASGSPHADHCCRTINSQPVRCAQLEKAPRSEEHTSELQSLMRISYAVFCLKKKNKQTKKKQSKQRQHN